MLPTDLVDSARHVETLGDARAAEAFAAHNRAARDLLAVHCVREIEGTDGFLLLFNGASQAAANAVAYHRAVATLGNTVGLSLSARAGIHEGEVVLSENTPGDVPLGAKPLEVEGIPRPSAVRIMALAVGGQRRLSGGARAARTRSLRGTPGFASVA